MIEELKVILKEQKISIYSIEECITEGAELYFIRRNLDMRRGKNVHSCTVTVYRDFEENGEKYRGKSSVVIPAGMAREEIQAKLSGAFFAARLAKAKWYPIASGRQREIVDTEPELKYSWEAQTMELAQAAYSEEDTFIKEKAAAGAAKENIPFLNSFEIFSSKIATHIVNSEGVDVSYVAYKLNGEFVAQCLEPQDVETYEDFSYKRFSSDAIAAKVRRVLERTYDRAYADKTTPAGKYRLILSDKYVPTIMSFYLNRSNAADIYMKYSTYSIGDQVQTSDDADLLDISLCASEPYSEEGIPMEDKALLEKGTLKNIHGDSRFCYYLNASPTGVYRKLAVKPGKASVDELKKRPYLHVVNFSDFQMDEFTGNFGGEIRLGYLYDGERVSLVTGGSINGSIFEAQKHMTLSKEIQEEAEFSGPLAIAMDNVTAAGE